MKIKLTALALLLSTWSAGAQEFTGRYLGPAFVPAPVPAILNQPHQQPHLQPRSSLPDVVELKLSDLSALRWRPPTQLPPKVANRNQRCVDREMHQWINYYSDLFKLDRSLVYALIYQESKCDPHAISHAGAVGLMQLMPKLGAREAVGELTGRPADVLPEVLKDPQTNIMLGTAYLRFLLNRYAHHPEGEPRIRLALAAYNWGHHRVDRRIPDFSKGDPTKISREWSARIPVPETKKYVSLVTTYYFYLKSLPSSSS